MPAKYHFVSPGVWNRVFRACTLQAKVVAFNVMTNRTRTSEGIYELSVGHIAEDTGLSAEQVTEALRELHDTRLVRYDFDAEVVFDTWALKTSPHRNGRSKDTGEVRPDRRTAPFIELFVRLPDSPLKQEFVGFADDYSPDLAAALRERVPTDPPAVPLDPEGPTDPEGSSSTATSSTGLPRTAPSPPAQQVSKCPACCEPDGWCGCSQADRIATAMPGAVVA